MIYPSGRPLSAGSIMQNARLAEVESESHPIILYDGICGLCNRVVQFVLRHDRKAIFHFAALQSSFGQQILARHNNSANEFDTVCLVLGHGQCSERVLVRSDATQFIFQKLGGLWRLLSSAANFIPRPVRDWAYRIIARHRYRLFGRYETCPLASPETKARFLDQ